MNKTFALCLLSVGAHKGGAFQLQPRQSAAQKRYRSVNTIFNGAPIPVTKLHSSFTDLSGREDSQDDKIQILLDSLDSLRTTPKEPEPVEPDDPVMDEMVEKMAMPLKFFKGREVKKERSDDAVATDEEAAKVHSKPTDEASPNASSQPDGLDAKTDESLKEKIQSLVPPSKDPEAPAVIEKAQPKSAPENIVTDEKPSVATAPTNDKPTKAIITEKVTSEEKPAASTSDKPATTTETQETAAAIKSDSIEEKPSNDIIRKIFDRTQTIDQPTKSDSPSQTSLEKTSEKESTPGSSSQPNDGNLKALIQTLQPTTPTLPSFSLPDLGSLEFGVLGGAIVIMTLYLSLAAYLRGVDKDEGYAEWDQYKRKDDKEDASKRDVDTALDAAVGAVKDANQASTPYGLVNKGANPFIGKTATNADVPKSVSGTPPRTKPIIPPKNTAAQKPPVKMPAPKAEEDKSFNKVTAQLERLDKLEQEADLIESIVTKSVTPSSTGSIEVQKIEEYCEPKKINPECSESISNYLGSLSEQQVEEGAQKAAAQKIISYLDSLSPTTKGPSFTGTVPTKSKIADKAPSQTSAAFTSYLDALSTGSVAEPPSAKAVASYLDILTTESAAASKKIDNRIIEVEDRLNRLESSVASLPDNIASRLIEWQTRQDQKVNDEIEKIKLYLMSEKSSSGSRDGQKGERW